MIGYAARYGHQKMIGDLKEVTVDRLHAFMEGVEHWVKKENESGSSRQTGED